MENARRHLADLVEEGLANGFERIQLEHEVRASQVPSQRVPGWSLQLGGGVAGDRTGGKFLPDAAFEDAGSAYVAEVATLIRGWARHGIPAQDLVGTVLLGPTPCSFSTDLGFLLSVFARGTDAQREILRAMLAKGIPPMLLASAAREAFEAFEQDSAA